MQLEQKLKHYRISDSEYKMICDTLKREPQGVEWALFSALWSEHCSYKSSKVHLKKFYSKSDRVLESFGENAGVVDLGEGERVAFKMESHNHPSFISPMQGAATGVGGILRDIFTMGARPVALANYLCFGEPEAERMSHLVDGVVDGISFYGNCVGVPMLTGQTEFHESYNGNILVNAFALGLFRPGEKVFTSKNAKAGQLIVYVGAKTGRDGVHGASMASESFEEGDESKKPTVQIGDPFFEKLLIESCLEVMEMDLVESIQDMGAAGLTSSAFEMASKSGKGFQMHLDKVPMRDEGMTPEEILLSESQERMLLTCLPEKLEQIQKVFKHWDLDAEVIGEVTDSKEVELLWNKETLVKIDPDVLVENAPLYQRPFKEWVPQFKKDSLSQVSEVAGEAKDILLNYFKSVQGGSKNWIYDQYDQRVGAKTHRDCSKTFGVLRLPDSGRGLAIALGCRPGVMRFDSFEGGKDSVVFPSLQMAAKGFIPIALTDCLNFGNPEKESLMTEFVAALKGMNEVCKSFDVPVISGNVSLYNETGEQNVTSTPSTGVVGLRQNLKNIPQDEFVEPGNSVYVLSSSNMVAGGLAHELSGLKPEGVGEIDVENSFEFKNLLLHLAEKDFLVSNRVVGKMGLLGCLGKMCLKGVGASVDLSGREKEFGSKNKAYFLESFYEVVFEIAKGQEDEFEGEVSKMGFSGKVEKLGQTQNTELTVEGDLTLSVGELIKAYDGAWKEHFETLA